VCSSDLRSYVPGFMILNDDFTFEHIEMPDTVAPRFYTLPYNQNFNLIPGNKEKDYYRIDVPANLDLKEIGELRKLLTNVKVGVIPSGVEVRSRVEEYFYNNLITPSQIDIYSMIEVYTTMHTKSEEQAKRLLEVGNTLATSALGGK
jgi:hypothetical protein